MNSRLSHLCESIIEAGWLAALIVVPLFFNVHSSRVFEPDKLSLLRSIALVMAVAWIVKAVNDWGSPAAARADQDTQRPSLGQRIVSTPLVLPTLVLVLAYLASTVLSVSPRISWWGSYQRLQGTYTTLSYVIIFFLALGHLRRPQQWQRIVYAIILTSLPISIYGVLQKTGLDPLPWGGDVQRRIAANMGNAIFVAAYLLMALFLTLQRLMVHFGRLLREEEQTTGIADAVIAGCYLFIAVLQVAAILFTQSRGPFLGLAAGLYVFALVGLLGLRSAANSSALRSQALRSILRWAWAGVLLAAVAGIAFFVVFNLPSSPLASLRDNPYIGRLGTAFDFDSQTAKVRTLIWQGAVELVPPHDPLEYPATGGEGDVTTMEPDRANLLRPLVGYGPESMWVAFNRFYPPDLAHYENRNASPDRSHNETFDSLVITGLVGFVAYMVLFLSVFYYCLKWLGLIRSHGQRTWFLLLALAGAAVGALVPLFIQGTWILSGVGLPAGLIVGIILYITGAAIWNEGKGLPIALGRRELLIMTILATVVAHFIEIHFGIAIAATRTYFWLWCAVLVVTGMGWLELASADQLQPATAPAPKRTDRGSRRRKRRGPPAPASTPERLPAMPAHWLEVTIYAVLLSVILFTLAYDFTINSNQPELREDGPVAVFWQSLTTRVDGNVRMTSLGVLWMVFFTWLVGLAVALAGMVSRRNVERSGSWLLGAAGLFTLVSGGIFLVFGLIHGASIAGDARVQQAGLTPEQILDRIASSLAGNITVYYLLLFLLMVLLAFLIWRTRPGEMRWLGRFGWIALATGAVLSAATVAFIASTNLSLVHADIIYKVGQAYDSARQYDSAIYLYEKAVQQQPDEDYYYLFLGRAQLEQARQSSGAERERYLRDAEASLLEAQRLNPLNTDHTANLGRLYLTWAQMVPADRRQELVQRTLDYYQVATSLSPNAAHLHNEYGTAYQVAGDRERALEQFRISLDLDQQYLDTYRRLADLYEEMGQVDQAIQALEQAVEIGPRDFRSHSQLGYLYAQRGELEKAIDQNLTVVELRPRDLASLRNLAILHQETGDLQAALRYAEEALGVAQDETDRADLEAFILQLQQLLSG